VPRWLVFVAGMLGRACLALLALAWDVMHIQCMGIYDRSLTNRVYWLCVVVYCVCLFVPQVQHCFQSGGGVVKIDEGLSLAPPVVPTDDIQLLLHCASALRMMLNITPDTCTLDSETIHCDSIKESTASRRSVSRAAGKKKLRPLVSLAETELTDNHSAAFLLGVARKSYVKSRSNDKGMTAERPLPSVLLSESSSVESEAALPAPAAAVLVPCPADQISTAARVALALNLAEVAIVWLMRRVSLLGGNSTGVGLGGATTVIDAGVTTLSQSSVVASLAKGSVVDALAPVGARDGTPSSVVGNSGGRSSSSSSSSSSDDDFESDNKNKNNIAPPAKKARKHEPRASTKPVGASDDVTGTSAAHGGDNQSSTDDAIANERVEQERCMLLQRALRLCEVRGVLEVAISSQSKARRKIKGKKSAAASASASAASAAALQRPVPEAAAAAVSPSTGLLSLDDARRLLAQQVSMLGRRGFALGRPGASIAATSYLISTINRRLDLAKAGNVATTDDVVVVACGGGTVGRAVRQASITALASRLHVLVALCKSVDDARQVDVVGGSGSKGRGGRGSGGSGSGGNKRKLVGNKTSSSRAPRASSGSTTTGRELWLKTWVHQLPEMMRRPLNAQFFKHQSSEHGQSDADTARAFALREAAMEAFKEEVRVVFVSEGAIVAGRLLNLALQDVARVDPIAARWVSRSVNISASQSSNDDDSKAAPACDDVGADVGQQEQKQHNGVSEFSTSSAINSIAILSAAILRNELDQGVPLKLCKKATLLVTSMVELEDAYEAEMALTSKKTNNAQHGKEGSNDVSTGSSDVSMGSSDVSMGSSDVSTTLNINMGTSITSHGHDRDVVPKMMAQLLRKHELSSAIVVRQVIHVALGGTRQNAIALGTEIFDCFIQQQHNNLLLSKAEGTGDANASDAAQQSSNETAACRPPLLLAGAPNAPSQALQEAVQVIARHCAAARDLYPGVGTTYSGPVGLAAGGAGAAAAASSATPGRACNISSSSNGGGDDGGGGDGGAEVVGADDGPMKYETFNLLADAVLRLLHRAILTSVKPRLRGRISALASHVLNFASRGLELMSKHVVRFHGDAHQLLNALRVAKYWVKDKPRHDGETSDIGSDMDWTDGDSGDDDDDDDGDDRSDESECEDDDDNDASDTPRARRNSSAGTIHSRASHASRRSSWDGSSPRSQTTRGAGMDYSELGSFRTGKSDLMDRHDFESGSEDDSQCSTRSTSLDNNNDGSNLDGSEGATAESAGHDAPYRPQVPAPEAWSGLLTALRIAQRVEEWAAEEVKAKTTLAQKMPKLQLKAQEFKLNLERSLIRVVRRLKQGEGAVLTEASKRKLAKSWYARIRKRMAKTALTVHDVDVDVALQLLYDCGKVRKGLDLANNTTADGGGVSVVSQQGDVCGSDAGGVVVVGGGGMETDRLLEWVFLSSNRYGRDCPWLNSKRRRSRNRFVDQMLDEEEGNADNFSDLEDFIVCSSDDNNNNNEDDEDEKDDDDSESEVCHEDVVVVPGKRRVTAPVKQTRRPVHQVQPRRQALIQVVVPNANASASKRAAAEQQKQNRKQRPKKRRCAAKSVSRKSSSKGVCAPQVCDEDGDKRVVAKDDDDDDDDDSCYEPTDGPGSGAKGRVCEQQRGDFNSGVLFMKADTGSGSSSDDDGTGVGSADEGEEGEIAV
jgi:hypothetical protein